MCKLKYLALSTILCSAFAFAGPQGFNGPASSGANANIPRGFEQDMVNTVAQIKRHSRDEQIVTVRGRLTQALTHDKYVFTDLRGDTIEVELDDDYDWSHISKDQLIDITGEVDKDLMSTTIDVRQAVPVQQAN